MRPSIDLWNLLGWTAVVGMLVLASPGVTIVHAEAEAQAARAIPAPGPACQAGAEDGHATRRSYSVDLSGLVATQAPGTAAGAVTLHTGGYGYGEELPAGPADVSGVGTVVPRD